MFHHNVAKLLYLWKWSRLDIQTAVAFLTTRVKYPDEDELKKLRWVIRYQRNTSLIPLSLEAVGTHIIKWWVDTAYATHHDMKSQRSYVWIIYISELALPILWRYFLESQRYKVHDSVLYQEKQSAMILEKNCRGSRSKMSLHINLRYFFI